MNKIARSLAVLLLLWCGAMVRAQVMTPMELPDPKTQHLQQQHLQTLMAVGEEIKAHKFPYPFYFNRTIDVDFDKMQLADQRSIRFDIYKNQTVLEVTGSYSASYAADRMDAYARLKETFAQVVAPILQAEVPHFPDDSEFSAFAIEIAHHVRQKVMGINSEEPENVTVIMPIAVAQRFVDAKDDEQRQGAILDAEVFLNGHPYALWLRDGAPTEEWKERIPAHSAVKLQTVSATPAVPDGNPAAPTISRNLLKDSPMRILTPETLAGMQRRNQDAVDAMVKALDPEAHFLPYAPPTFIGFRQGAYLQLSLQTQVEAPATASRYKRAALAFDDHIAHLIRPLLEHLPPDVEFDGVDFSSIIHLPDGSAGEAVEFFFPYRMMRCFAGYDCTGQQLLDAGTVVINGERASLDLQVAEGKN